MGTAPRLLGAPVGLLSSSSPPPAHAHSLHLTHFEAEVCVCVLERKKARAASHIISPVGAFDFL